MTSKISLSEIKSITEELPEVGMNVIFLWELDLSTELEAESGFLGSDGKFRNLAGEEFRSEPDYFIIAKRRS